MTFIWDAWTVLLSPFNFVLPHSVVCIWACGQNAINHLNLNLNLSLSLSLSLFFFSLLSATNMFCWFFCSKYGVTAALALFQVDIDIGFNIDIEMTLRTWARSLGCSNFRLSCRHKKHWPRAALLICKRRPRTCFCFLLKSSSNYGVNAAVKGSGHWHWNAIDIENCPWSLACGKWLPAVLSLVNTDLWKCVVLIHNRTVLRPLVSLLLQWICPATAGYTRDEYIIIIILLSDWGDGCQEGGWEGRGKFPFWPTWHHQSKPHARRPIIMYKHESVNTWNCMSVHLQANTKTL